MITNLNSDFKPVVRYGKVIPNYYCNQNGDVYSTIGKSGRFLKPKVKWSARLTMDERRLRCHSYTLSIPKDLFDDYNHRARGKGHSPAMSIDRHRIVMETWRPIDEYPPDQVAKCWNEIPEDAKEWVRKTAYVDHIDDNPANNHVDNLRWVRSIDNQSHRKKALING